MTRATILKAVAIATALLIGFLVLRSCMTKDARQAAAGAKVDAQLSDARAAAGKDAVETVGNAATRENEIDTITRENDDAIHAAPGAAAPVDPALGRAARLGLCRRAAYRDSVECKRLLEPGAE